MSFCPTSARCYLLTPQCMHVHAAALPLQYQSVTNFSHRFYRHFFTNFLTSCCLERFVLLFQVQILRSPHIMVFFTRQFLFTWFSRINGCLSNSTAFYWKCLLLEIFKIIRCSAEFKLVKKCLNLIVQGLSSKWHFLWVS